MKILGILLVLCAMLSFSAFAEDCSKYVDYSTTDVPDICHDETITQSYDGDPMPEYSQLIGSCSNLIISQIYSMSGEPEDWYCPDGETPIADQLVGVPLADFMIYSTDEYREYVWKAIIGRENIEIDANCDGSVDPATEIYTYYVRGFPQSNYEWVDINENHCADLIITGWDDPAVAKYSDKPPKHNWVGGRLVEFNEQKWFTNPDAPTGSATEYFAGFKLRSVGTLIPNYMKNDDPQGINSDLFASASGITAGVGTNFLDYIPEFTTIGIILVISVYGIYVFRRKK
jgi:hypothetical protein